MDMVGAQYITVEEAATEVQRCLELTYTIGMDFVMRLLLDFVLYIGQDRQIHERCFLRPRPFLPWTF